ncbi:MAG: XRE family transcriptional regulator [Comamonadaceae bacterium]|nr:MAG: XRE family transcriptional regulator [Comamonadaceae bacterium]
MSRLVCSLLEHIKPRSWPVIPLRISFGHRVRDLRRASGMSQEEFADKCGFARTYMSRIETGGANPSLDAIQVLATALRIPVATLFEKL